MNRCRACGFDNVEPGKPCPSCKTMDGAHLHELETMARPLTPIGFGRLAEAIFPDGTMYAKRYRITGFLGRGGMGSVYKVVDTRDNREMALKILHKETASESDGAERFKREIEILSKMDHPSVPKVFGWGFNEDSDRELYFVAEYIEGQDLKSIIRDKGPWAPADAAALAARIADVLAVAHSMGIIHRDVKPHNIMIGKNDSVKLLDFGVARNKGAGTETLTQTGMVIGTPEYMSPEQFGTNKVDERSDIYSLGVVLFELLTGKVPFDGGTPVAIAMKVVEQAPVAPRSVRPDTPAWIERIVLQCLQKDPKKRYLTADELAIELRKERAGPRRRWLPTGDAVIEDDSGNTDWALVLSSAREKPDWLAGIGMRFDGRLYKLEKIKHPTKASPRWQYCFSYWPEDEVLVFNKLIDYESYATLSKPVEKKKESFGTKVKRWIVG